jgi:hypothetical protein
VKIYSKFVPIIFMGLLGVVFLVSLFFFVFSENWVRRVLFFPHVGRTKVVGEERFLPDLGSEEANVMLLVNEIVSGPYKYENLPVIPVDTKIKSAILHDHILYVNFSNGIFKINKLVLISPRQILQAFADSVLYNFPDVKKVVVFIEGHQVSNYSEANRLHFYKYLKDFIIIDITDLGRYVAALKNNPLLEYCAGLKSNTDFENGIVFSADIIE